MGRVIIAKGKDTSHETAKPCVNTVVKKDTLPETADREAETGLQNMTHNNHIIPNND